MMEKAERFAPGASRIHKEKVEAEYNEALAAGRQRARGNDHDPTPHASTDGGSH